LCGRRGSLLSLLPMGVTGWGQVSVFGGGGGGGGRCERANATTASGCGSLQARLGPRFVVVDRLGNYIFLVFGGGRALGLTREKKKRMKRVDS
jgi:hypothetical protein